MAPLARLTLHTPTVLPKLNGLIPPPVPSPLPLAPLRTLAFWDLGGNRSYPDSAARAKEWKEKGGHGWRGEEEDTVGLFGLESGGEEGVGVRVGERRVWVARGTVVCRGAGMGEAGQEGMSLWWSVGEQVWTLGLIGATTADLAAIHRVLLFLPPLPPPKPQRLTLPRTLPTLHNLGVAPSASLPHPSYRNSLVLLDQSTNEILSVLPLSTPAAEESLLPMVDLSLQANPGRGAKLAAQVDEITDGMFPGRKLGGDRSAVERNGEEPQGRGEAMSGQDGNADGVYLALVDEVEKVEKELVKREDRCVATEESTVGQRTLERREVGFTLLDAELGSLRAFETKQHVEARTVGFASQTSDHSLDFFLADDEPSPCRPHSLRSISSNLPRTNLESEARPTSTTSFASIGTQFFETASEGGRTAFGTAAEGESEADSRRTSSATFASDWTEQGRALRAQELDVEDASDDDRTPRPSLLLDHHLAPHVEDNAVLLQFFGESSTITVGRVSGKEIGERGLVPATGEAGWGWLDVLGLGEVVKGLGSWFGGWWRTSSPSSSISSSDASSPSGSSSPASYFFPAFDPASLAATPRPVARGGRANGETTSRLSVLFFDDEGFGRRAYVEGAGGGAGGRIGG